MTKLVGTSPQPSAVSCPPFCVLSVHFFTTTLLTLLAGGQATASLGLDNVDGESMHSRVDVESLMPVRSIGVGGQARVWLARSPTSPYLQVSDIMQNLTLMSSEQPAVAVKEYSKARLSQLPIKSATRALAERQCLLECDGSPFLTRCLASFQTAESLFLVIELAPGGDLHAWPEFHQGLSEPPARFYCACIALALSYLHRHGWIYRDMKLENVLIHENGYAKLSDLGYAKKLEHAGERAYTFCGTDEYAPPELVLKEGRCESGDWWGLGILMHEILVGYPPFEGSTADDVFDSIVDYAQSGDVGSQELQLNALESSAGQLSHDGADFICGLLAADEAERLGADQDGFVGLATHPWHATTDWEKMRLCEVQAPWVPASRSRGPEEELLGPHTVDDELGPVEYDPATAAIWDPIFADFGPFRAAPWPGAKPIEP